MASFENALLNCPEKGMEQSDIGLRHMRDLSAVMLKVASIEEDHTQRINRLVADALAKMHSSGEARDGMATVHQAIMGTLTSMVQLNKHRNDLARRMAEQVGEPLDRFYRNGVSRLKMLIKREKDERMQLENQKNAVAKQKSQCLRLFEQSQTGAPDVAGQDKPSRLFKLAGTIGARALTVSEAVEKLNSATSLYDEMLESASILQERYFNVCLPEVLSALECLELDRGAILVNQLKISASEVQILSENTQKEAVQLQSLCDRIDIAKDLTQFVHDIALIPDQIFHTRKKSVFVFDLPVSPPDSVFRKSLENLVSANNGNAPLLLKHLIKRLRELNALSNIEGIFRVSPDKSQISSLKRQIESSESIAAALEATNSAHLLAATLKEWLRGLPQPLIPNELYDEVLRIGSQSGPEQHQALAHLWQMLLPRASKIVIIELKEIIDEVVANADRTKMSVYNICVCLSPSLVRTPESIPASVVLANSKLEVAFAAALFTSRLSLSIRNFYEMSHLVIPSLQTIDFGLVTINDDAVTRFADFLRQQTPRRAIYTEFDLHPQPNDELCANWVFLIDSLNFSFWHLDPSDPYRVEFEGREFFGYGSLCAIIKRAHAEGYPMTDAAFWRDLDKPTWRHIARGVTCEIPLLQSRLEILNSTGKTLVEQFDADFSNVINQADHDVYKLIQLVLAHFPYFRDQTPDGRHKFMKRVQILVADLWSCFDGAGLGKFDNIDEITMFADYRVPQALLELGILEYSAELMETLVPGEKINDLNENVSIYSCEEIEIRAASILAVDRIKEQLGRDSPWNAILIDFYLWNYSKDIDRGKVPFHRLRTVFY